MDSVTFYFDRCFGKRFPEALLKMRSPFKVEYHHSPANKFPEEMEDDEWLAKVGAKGWFVFSHDKKWHDESPRHRRHKRTQNWLLLPLGRKRPDVGQVCLSGDSLQTHKGPPENAQALYLPRDLQLPGRSGPHSITSRGPPAGRPDADHVESARPANRSRPRAVTLISKRGGMSGSRVLG